MLTPKKISTLSTTDIIVLKGYEEILIEMFGGIYPSVPITFKVIKNTYGADPWIYFDDIGQYELRHEKGFPQHRTFCIISPVQGAIAMAHYANSIDPNGQIDISITDVSGAFVQGCLDIGGHVGTFLHVKIYPPLPD